MLLCPATILAAALFATDAQVDSQSLLVKLDPATHEALVTVSLDISGKGEVRFRLNSQATEIGFQGPDQFLTFNRIESPDKSQPHLLRIKKELDVRETVTITYRARFEQNINAGEVEGQIHNKSVSAHLGEDGIFLSDGAAWHPQWIDEAGHPQLMLMSVDVEPIPGWSIVASGEPIANLGALTDPVWTWITPRPVDGIAIVGNRHVIVGEDHFTPYGNVEILMHIAPEHEELASMFIEATKSYLDLYVPLLGPFPYRRFSIVENFFSSGFAYPGFTVLGPQVVGMAPRSLAPGYLDHELIHNWWGNGVYASPDDGNWCEALTSYCANYYRRIADDGEEAGRDYRRGLLMKLSTNPDLFDNGPLDQFGHNENLNRFVGYDKGAFIFTMLEGGGAYRSVTDDRAAMFRGLHRFAEDNMGRRASWDDLKIAFEAEFDSSLSGFFDLWVRQHTLPRTDIAAQMGGMESFASQYGAPLDDAFMVKGEDWIEVDPEFRLYRVLPPDQLIPTIAGTFGLGDVKVISRESRSEVQSYLPRIGATDDGENLMLIGHVAIESHERLLNRTSDLIRIQSGSFTLDGTTYDQPGQAILHTMGHPDRPGRFITIFHANGEAGWDRLRLINFYTRDTSIVWEDGQVLTRRVHEPDRRLKLNR
ncbi:MAG: hypothetical protein O7G85_14955 [Planctomycetota bacterium]|nr:hypothetical protein [Planctomycetota bacterium]